MGGGRGDCECFCVCCCFACCSCGVCEGFVGCGGSCCRSRSEEGDVTVGDDDGDETCDGLERGGGPCWDGEESEVVMGLKESCAAAPADAVAGQSVRSRPMM